LGRAEAGAEKGLAMYRRLGVSILAVCGLVVGACSGSSDEVPRFLLPCDDPAPLTGVPSSSNPQFIVTVRDDVDTVAEATRLASTCGFEVLTATDSFHQFLAVFDIIQLGCVRCDEVVTLVEPRPPIVYPSTLGAGHS
jgi:hypothetical protein